MKEVTRLFSDLKNISGNIAKADFIRTNMSNKTFMNSLRFLIRTDNPTGISTKKYDKWEDSDSMFIDESKNPPKETTLEDIFSYLEVHNSGRDEDVRYIRTFGNVWCEDEEDKEFYKRIICKDYPIGVDAKSLNKIIPNFIPVWDVCLCNKYYDKPSLVDGSREFAIGTKIDGCRCVAVKENGNVRLISRQGKVWLGLIDVEEDIKNINADNFVFDGELTVDDFMKYPSNDVYKMTTKLSAIAANPKRIGNRMKLLVLIERLMACFTAFLSSCNFEMTGNNTPLIEELMLFVKRCGKPSPRLKKAKSAVVYFKPIIYPLN